MTDAGQARLCVVPTLDAILRANVRRTPAMAALVDPPDRLSFTSGAARALTYAQLDRSVDRLAVRLRDLNLGSGCVVATLLPNTIEAVVALLAIWRADLVAAPLPLLWGEIDAAEAIRRADARAIVTAGPVAGVNHGEVACRIAAEAFNVRYVCGFGDVVGDGMVPLGTLAPDDATVETPSGQNAPTADRPRLVTFDIDTDGPRPALRADAQLLAGGFAVVSECAMPPAATILGTMLPSSFAVIATTLVPWLITGGTLRLHHPFAPAALAERLKDLGNLAVLPGALLPLLAGAVAAARLVALWRAPEQHRLSPPWQGSGAVTDVLAFGETGIVARRRLPDGAPAPLRAGALCAGESATTVATLSCNANGTLNFSSPMLPLGGDGASGYACRVDPLTNELVIGAPPAGLAQIGGYRFAMAALQDILGRADARGMLAALPDLLAGQKLAGTAPDTARLRETLMALGLSPLVTNAFREPGQEPGRSTA